MTASLGHAILLVLGVIALAKSLWGLLSPGSWQRFTRRAIDFIPKINTLLAWLYMAIGISLFVVILLHQPIAYWLLAFFGTLMLFASAVLLRFKEYEGFVRRIAIYEHTLTSRIVCGIGVIVALLIIWVAFRDPWI